MADARLTRQGERLLRLYERRVQADIDRWNKPFPIRYEAAPPVWMKPKPFQATQDVDVPEPRNVENFAPGYWIMLCLLRQRRNRTK